MNHIYTLYTESGTINEEGSLSDRVRCKIGITDNPKTRFNQLQTGMHEVLAAHAWKINDPNVIEKSFHTIFKKDQVRGEWFSIAREEFEALCWILNSVALYCNCRACNGYYNLQRAQQVQLKGKQLVSTERL